MDHSKPFVLSCQEVTIDQDHLIYFLELLAREQTNAVEDSVTHAVEHLSLNVKEVVFLIHDFFINLGDLGDYEVEKDDA